LLADQHVDDAAAAEGGAHRYTPRLPLHDAADHGRLAPERVAPQCRQSRLGRLLRHDRDELSFVGEIEQVEPEDLAKAFDLLAQRRLTSSRSGVAASSISIATADAAAISFSTVAAAPRVGSRRQLVSGAASSSAAISRCRAAQSLSQVRINAPYGRIRLVDNNPPGGSSMNGIILSGKPGAVQPIQMPPTF
jgi:hypothetical protein